jgi:exopolysaccharide biosynthesis polyprenyl glycosylphosphotransferase
MFDDITHSFVEAQSEGLLRFSLNPAGRAWSMGIMWLLILRANNSRNHRIVGHDNEEYKRVFGSGVAVLMTLALFSLFFKLDVSRLFVGLAISSGTLLLLISRWAWRQWLRGQRARGNYRSAVAIAGSAGIVSELLEQLARDTTSNFKPTLLVAPSQKDVAALAKFGLPVVAEFSDPAAVLLQNRVDAVILVGSEFLTKQRFKTIAWNLESSPVDLIVAPGLLDASSPRVHSRQVSGVSFLEVESPTFDGSRFAFKQSFDIVASAVLIVIFSPVLLITAIAVKVTDRGPVFFLQERHGRDGKIFKMIKFRSMRVGAEKQHEELKKLSETELVNTNMFKLPNDPRITKVGKFIRKYSIDELPQLFNVLKGDMSLVGPRPPLPSEVQEYETHVHRRLLVKPGITGIWQVSGRASLSWEETVRLDLDYVENWSFAGDLVILGKTVGAVFGKSGAF